MVRDVAKFQTCMRACLLRNAHLDRSRRSERGIETTNTVRKGSDSGGHTGPTQVLIRFAKGFKSSYQYS